MSVVSLLSITYNSPCFIFASYLPSLIQLRRDITSQRLQPLSGPCFGIHHKRFPFHRRVTTRTWHPPCLILQRINDGNTMKPRKNGSWYQALSTMVQRQRCKQQTKEYPSRRRQAASTTKSSQQTPSRESA